MRPLSPIARNFGHLFVRQGIVAAADMLSIRLVLKAIGVEMQGVCAMAAGWVAVFSFFSGTLRAAFQRFLSAETGRAANGDASTAFSVSLGISIAAGLVVLLLGETFGLYGLTRILSFSSVSAGDVHVVYQLTLIGAVFRFISLPHQALVVARERMGILASCGLVESFVLVALSASLLLLPDGIRLPACAGMAAITASSSLAYLAYRLRRYPELHAGISFNPLIMCRILVYFGWSGLGSLVGMLRLSGTETVLNRWRGVAFNSSWNTAFRAGSCIYVLISSLQQAVEPQLVKRLEAGDWNGYLSLAFRSERWLIGLVWAVAFPMFFFAPEFVGFWLGAEQPPQIVAFLRMFILYFFVDALSAPIHSAIMSSVRIGRYTVVVSTFGALGFVGAVLTLLSDAPAWVAAACLAGANAACLLFRLAYFCRSANVGLARISRELILPTACAAIASAVLFAFR